ncbi:MAG: hypothetical protein CUN51_08265 [Candidatus Thermofonsia Clade 1 bacterium]|uniref:Multidrug ABC transporter substrate-binding protein n=1 Tax=Candidatus Thermofonsia Clade 1 bacterium TaxID=2364210 RepID=A0A2M8NYB3_9CHLR|nr:MAG: hypothetical protein CUN51_08265 [Candidatus Thermofonsia Clade 1 bacterium]
MNFFRNFGIAIDALLANKLRSGLTMLGIIIGVASVVALLSIGNGVQQSINSQITSIGTNLVTVVPGQVRINAGPPTSQGIRTPTQIRPLTDADANAIRERVPDLLGVAPELTVNNVTVAYQRERILITARGVTVDYNRVRNLEIAQGRWFEAAEDERASRVAILGSDAADALFGGLNPIGQTIRVGNAPFTVIGVTVPVGAGFAGNPDTSIFVPLQTAYRTISNARTASGARRVSVIYISALSSEDIPRVERDVTQVMRQQHAIREGAEDDFTVLTQQQFLSIAGSITGILTLFLGAIAGISLLVGGIGIMNIMLVSVTERTKEIGLRKAVGAKKRTILMQFLVETVTLSLIGGTFGILFGVSIALLVGATGVITTTVTLESIVLAVSFSLAVGLFFGIYPANRAASLQPIEAVRYE